jgi:hypothetical protein
MTKLLFGSMRLIVEPGVHHWESEVECNTDISGPLSPVSIKYVDANIPDKAKNLVWRYR